MSGRLSSHRFRRRLFAAGICVLLVAAITGAVIVGNTGKSTATPIDQSQPAWVNHPQTKSSLSRGDRAQIVGVASRFVKTAVLRKHLDIAWSMLGPEMRAGQTRKEWDTGNNNVVPFDAIGILAWKIDYTYHNDVGIDMALLGSKTSTFAGKTFTIELKRYPQQPHRWLVASWVPRGVGGAGQVKALAKLPVSPTLQPRVSAKWLYAPAVFFAGILLLFSVWGLQSSVRQRRTARKYSTILGHTQR